MNSRIIDTQHALMDVQHLLKECHLPYEDIRLKDNFFLGYYTPEGDMIGCGGLEFYASYALLRSFAIAPTHRNRALGKQLLKDLLEHARSVNMQEVYLLTETAHEFFTRFRFRDVTRDHVPKEVQASTEFASICSTSAACMVYYLTK